MNRIAKIAAVTVGFTMALGVATPAGAQTIEQLQAQINALLAQLSALQGGTQTSGSVTFTRDLTIGATGADVTALQNWLISKGYAIPAGATGYFGTQTRAAVAAYQTAQGISPTAGYFGPVTRARVNASAGVTTPGTTTPGAGITTPGVEGTLTASVNPTPVSGVKVYEGDSRAAVLGLRLEANLSDIRVERVKVQLPSNASSFYNRAASRIYIMDGSTVVGSADLNSNTVVREGSDYFVTVAGINYVVPRNTTRVLTVALDMYSSINIGSGTGEVASSQTLTIPVDGIRGVDGAGINLFAPTTGNSFSRSFSIEQDEALTANLKISLNPNSPVAATVVANDGSDEDEADGVELLRFDVRAEKDAIEIVDLKVTVSSSTTGGATTTTVYLYEGSNLIGSDVVGAGGVVTFENIDYVIPEDTTRTLSVKVDVAGASSVASTISATVTGNTTNFVAENSIGDTIGTVTGTATGQNMSFRSVGPEIVLVSKSLSSSGSNGENSTSTVKATFNFQITAVGGDLYFGPQTASTTFDFQVYKDNSAVTLATVASTTSWAKPSGTTAYATTGFVLAEGQTVTIPVDLVFQGKQSTGAPIDFGSYTVGVDAVNWSSDQGVTNSVSNFMAELLEWRTASQPLP